MTNLRFWWPFHGNVNAQILKIGSKLDYSNISFTAILLALHSILWPYRGIVHDARYYAFQALNNAKNGQFAHDLFLEFGSQDNYSVFSYFMGPLVAWMGLDVAFWLAYMAASALFIYATVRFFRSLIPDHSLANIAALALLAIPILYGGSGSFRIHENFFTARLIAQGLGILGITAIYRKCPYQALGFALASVAFHPIMGISSFLVIMAVLLKDRLQTRLAICTVLLLLLATLLCVALFKWDSIRPWIARDDLWFTLVKHRAFTCFPLKWRFVDWYRMVGSIAIIFGCNGWLTPRAKALTRIIAWTGIAGIISSVMGDFLACPILIQGQGFRAFWQIQVLALPLGFLAMNRFSSGFSAWSSWAALGIFIFLGNPFFVSADSDYLAITTFQIGLFLFVSAFFLFKKIACHRSRSLSVLLCSLIMVAGLSLAITGGIIHANAQYETGIGSIAHSVTKLSSRTFVFMLTLWILSVVLSIIKTPRSVTAFSLSVWLSVSLVTFMTQQSPEYGERLHPGYKDVQFIGDAINKNLHKSGQSLKDAQIYWPECPELIWFNLQANSYYSYSQTAGVVFGKETILEGLRRAALVKPFEVSRIKQSKPPLNEYAQKRLAFLNATIYEPDPTKKDLFRLANDRKIDWIILNIGFEGLYSATNQSVYIYDCSKIRRTNPVLH
jgi:hypothetical protein